MRFAVVSDVAGAAPSVGVVDVSIRFEVRGGFRPEAAYRRAAEAVQRFNPL